MDQQQPTNVPSATPSKWTSWKRWGAIVAVLVPMVNKVAGSPLDANMVMLIVGALIAFVGIETYKDQKIAVANVLSEAQVAMKQLEADANAKALMDKINIIARSQPNLPTQPPKP